MAVVSRILATLKFLVPLVYLAGAVAVWVAFARSPPDGLANLGLVLYTFPVVFVGTFLLRQSFPYVHAGGYYGSHAFYYWPSVVVLAGLMFLLLHLAHRAAAARGRPARR